MTFPLPENEVLRLQTLHGLNLLDTLPEQDFDDLTVLASQIVGVPIALISLVDKDRQWFKSKVGLDLDQTSRSVSFCTHALMGSDMFEVEDATQDSRFANNPLVTGDPGIRFYAGVPLTSPNGANIGTLCAIDRVPRKLDEGQRHALQILARQVMRQIELRRILQERSVRSNERALLQELSNLLHSCLTMEEACQVIGRSMGKLFAEDAGTVFTITANGDAMEPLVRWGEMNQNSREFSRDSCWALRRGRGHRASAAADDLHCGHNEVEDRAAVCLPMFAQGESIGLLSILWQDSPRSDARLEWIHWLAATVADTLAVALASLRLREQLHKNSIRDPLTDLFNRRYMEETLTRELHRMQRMRLPMSVLALDLDHFKLLNDTYGHDAGDAVLRTFSRVLQLTFRQDDIVCRSGGEEFIVILPTADATIVAQRAEQLRRSAEQMPVIHNGKTLPTVTVSGGVAIYPQHATTGDELLRAADVALYQAKNCGRNRIVMTGAPVGISAGNGK